MTPNPLIYRSKTPEINTFLSLGHMNNLLLNLSDKTQLLNSIRLRRVERSRRRTKMLLIYLPFVSGFPGNFFFGYGLRVVYLFYCLDCFVGLEIAARLPQIDNEALLHPLEIKTPGFPSISCWFSLHRE